MKQKSSRIDYLSKESTDALRGCLCIAIVIHHVYQYLLTDMINAPIIRALLQNMGFWSVALFFFLSGYALMYSYDHKKNYLKPFVKQKILPLGIIYLLSTALYITYSLINGESFNFTNELKGLLLGYDVHSLWYLQATIYLYLLFYISYRRKTKFCNAILIAGIISYIVYCILIDSSIVYYATILNFPLGIAWNKKRNKIETKLHNKAAIYLIISATIFVLSFTLSKIVKIYYLANALMVISNLIITITIMLIYRIRPLNIPIIKTIGKASLEVYVFQFLFIYIFMDLPLIIGIPLILIATIISALLFYSIKINTLNNIFKRRENAKYSKL